MSEQKIARCYAQLKAANTHRRENLLLRQTNTELNERNKELIALINKLERRLVETEETTRGLADQANRSRDEVSLSIRTLCSLIFSHNIYLILERDPDPGTFDLRVRQSSTVLR